MTMFTVALENNMTQTSPLHTARYRAALLVAANWRIRYRLPRITAYAISLGLLI
jgi:hypothetical protein